MYPAEHAAVTPGRTAIVMAGSGASRTYAELDDRSARLAGWLHGSGVEVGDVVLVCLENDLRWAEIVWACLRSGLCVAPVNWHLTVGELVPLFEDASPAAVITSLDLVDGVREAAAGSGTGPHWLVVDRGRGPDTPSGTHEYEAALASSTAVDAFPEVGGSRLLFSSGTTGRPKPFRQPLPGVHPADVPLRLGPLLELLHFDVRTGEELVYLSTGPAYHAAPFAFLQTVHQLGGTVVMMERFDAEAALAAIQDRGVTHSQWVPTMLARLLRLPPEVRARFDLSTHRVAVHAGAPCPPDVKRALLSWWGPIVHEYYGASEGYGHTAIGPEDWLAHPGSVGRAVQGRVEIRDDDGHRLPAGSDGHVWFVRDTGEGAVGDLGHLDADGFLYLTGRVGNTIITGGVNVYPREVEDVLALHPAVADVAVLGVPDPEFGEQVRAVVEVAPGRTPGPELATEVIAYCRERLAHVKCPRAVDFVDRMPRTDAGKIRIGPLRERYRPRAAGDAPADATSNDDTRNTVRCNSC